MPEIPPPSPLYPCKHCDHPVTLYAAADFDVASGLALGILDPLNPPPLGTNTEGWTCKYIHVDDGSVVYDHNAEPDMTKCIFGFTPTPDCNNCLGTGIFSESPSGEPEDPCIFCTEDAIERGEIDGTIDGVEWCGGHIKETK